MKTIQEKIKIMQAFADGKRIEFQSKGNNRWSEVSSPEWDWQCYDYRVKCDVPRTWEEFCEQYDEHIKCDYFLTSDKVYKAVLRSSTSEGFDNALFNNVSDAEGLFALIKLRKLRDAWWGNWRPDYKSKETKYMINRICLMKDNNGLLVAPVRSFRTFLVFDTKEIAEDFLKCFKDLINKAEMWL